MTPYKETQYGFEYGTLAITRIHYDNKHGWVAVAIDTPKFNGQIYVTRTGKVRIWAGRMELKIPKVKKKK